MQHVNIERIPDESDRLFVMYANYKQNKDMSWAGVVIMVVILTFAAANFSSGVAAPAFSWTLRIPRQA